MRFSLLSMPPMIGSHRNVIKFLFLPKKLYNEWRWLEFSIVKQRYINRQKKYIKSGNILVKDIQEWVDESWEE